MNKDWISQMMTDDDDQPSRPEVKEKSPALKIPSDERGQDDFRGDNVADNDTGAYITANEYDVDLISKNAFVFDIGTPAILGAVGGGAMAYEGYKEGYDKKLKELDEKTNMDIGKDYYSQVKNVMSDLAIVFTPLGVLYSVKGLIVDQLETGQMDQGTLDAWKERNKDYFKNILYNKIHLQVQMAEQMFADRLIQKHIQASNQFQKKSSDQWDDWGDEQDITKLSYQEFEGGLASLNSYMEKTSGLKERKYLDYLTDECGSDTLTIDMKVPRPLEKVAFLGAGLLSTLGLLGPKNSATELRDHVHEQGYMRANLKVLFMPDRVIYVVDNVVITQLSLFQMNEKAYDRFTKNDTPYFRDYFFNQYLAGKGMAQEPTSTSAMAMAKVASASDIGTLFTQPDIDPLIYYYTLNARFGSEWIGWDPHVLLKEVEEEFELDLVADVPMNKIWFVQMFARQDTATLSDFHIFEKMVRTFNDKGFDFLAREVSLDIGDLVNALRIVDAILPGHDVFGEFSGVTIDYIVDALFDEECKVCYPMRISKSKDESLFFELINSELLDKWNKELSNDDDFTEVVQENKMVFAYTIKLITLLRSKKVIATKGMVRDLAKQLLERYNGQVDIHNEDSITLNVFRNLGADYYVDSMKKRFALQYDTYVSGK